MDLNIDYAKKILGIELTEQEVKNALLKQGLQYEKGKVKIPPYRVDFLHQIDIVEEIALGYGFEKFQPKIPKISTIGRENENEVKKRKIAEILCGLGLIETCSFHLTNKKVLSKSLISGDFIELENGNEEYNICRPNLISQQLKILSENTDSGYPQKIFELGKIFKKADTETGAEEPEILSVTLCSAESNFTEIKQVLDYLMRMLGINYEIKETQNPSFIKGRTGKVLVNGNEIGILGEIHPQIIENFKIKFPVCAMELNLSNLFDLNNL